MIEFGPGICGACEAGDCDSCANLFRHDPTCIHPHFGASEGKGDQPVPENYTREKPCKQCGRLFAVTGPQSRRRFCEDEVCKRTRARNYLRKARRKKQCQ